MDFNACNDSGVYRIIFNINRYAVQADAPGSFAGPLFLFAR